MLQNAHLDVTERFEAQNMNSAITSLNSVERLNSDTLNISITRTDIDDDTINAILDNKVLP